MILLYFKIVKLKSIFIIIILKQHHLFLLVIQLIILLIILILHIIIYLIILLTVFLQFFKLISICCSDKQSIHIEYLALWIHKKLSIISFNLDAPHYYIILHVHTYLLVSIVSIVHKFTA